MKVPVLLIPVFVCAIALAQQPTSGPWVMQVSGTTAGLRGIHAVGGGIAWASGANGTILRTEDGGYMWQSCAAPPNSDKLDFRGIWAWDANTAIVMSSGPGNQSRIYKTTDGCSHWKLLFTNPDKDGFWDAIVFKNRQLGFILGDPVGGRFVILTTMDGGETWMRDNTPGLQVGDGATGAFAASNSALLAGKRNSLVFGTAGGYIYDFVSYSSSICAEHPTNVLLCPHWTRTLTPLHFAGSNSGVFSLGYRQYDKSGYSYVFVAVGGDYTKPDDSAGTAAWSPVRQHWIAARIPPHGYRSAVAWDPTSEFWIAAGPNGSDISPDGNIWQSLDNGNWNALSLPYIVGPNGRIAKLDESKLPKIYP